MRKLVFFTLLSFAALQLGAQNNKADVLQKLERNQADNQSVTITATLKSASRLFGEKDDLTSVILIIPMDSTVTVLDSDSTYLHVIYDNNEGYILKRHVVIDKAPVVKPQVQETTPQQSVQESQPDGQEQVSRFSYLENKYGTNMAARLNAGKIWKGMNAEMVNDSWGPADKINRQISGNTIKEEWIYKNTWLYFENNTLVDWGPTRN